MSISTGTFPGVRIVDMPDLGAVSDTTSVVAEKAGSGRVNALALRSYTTAIVAADLETETEARIAADAANAAAATQHVNNIAALRVLSVASAAVTVLGYYAPGDGGGGTYVLGPSASDNGGSIIVSPSGTYYLITGAALSVRQFGAKGDGTTDDTAAIQATLNVGKAWHVPPGIYRFSALTVPLVVGFDLGGDGGASVLVQTGSGIKLAAGTGTFGALAAIHDLSFDGSAGTGTTLDMSRAQELDLIDLTFNSVPVGFDSVMLDGDAATSTFTHDNRVRGLRIYTFATLGRSGLHLGSFSSDSLVSDFNMNAAFNTAYCVLHESGSQNTSFQNMEIYNANQNAVGCMSGGGNGCDYTNVTFGNSRSGLFAANHTFQNYFANCLFQGINNSTVAVTLQDSSDFMFTNCYFTAETPGPGACLSCIAESGACSGNRVFNSWIDDPANYTLPFNMTSPQAAVVEVVNFRTQSKGVATWSGTSTKIVPHGLNVTPTVNDIMLQPQGPLTPANYCWPSLPTATTFTINLSDVPTNPVFVGWSIRAAGS